jgi:hypothetical protein
MSAPNTPNSAQGKLRYPHYTQLVEHDAVSRYIALGWERSNGLVDTHHGDRATLMVWPHNTEPPNE